MGPALGATPIAPSIALERWAARLPLLALLALGAPSEAQPVGVLSPLYEVVVRRYASGDREGAVAEISGWAELRIRAEIPALNKEWQRAGGQAFDPVVLRQMPVRAALMLHSDCAQRMRRDGRPARLHESASWSIARTILSVPAHRVFARRWYEAMAELAQGENRWGEALDWADRGLRDFPDAAGLLHVLGSVEESAATLVRPEAPDGALFDPSLRQAQTITLHAQEVRLHLATAERVLRSAVAADPSLHEARLRLGRVAWKLGEEAEARSILRDVLDRKPEAGTALLAHLFLGRLDEEAGRLEEAARSYEAALALDETVQSARVALSHVRLRRGDAASAQAQVETALSFSGLRPEPDPFWLYPWGPSVGVEERLEALRREASS